MQDTILYNGSTIHYLRYGRGDKVLLAMHGYGDHANLFSILKRSLEAHYTIYAIDLPWHGRTQWQADGFTPQDIVAIIDILLQKAKVNQFSLMGFSMGGRLVLSVLPHFSQQIERLFLVAPEGLSKRRLYGIDLLPKWFRNWVKGLFKSPEWFFRLLRFVRRIGLIREFEYEFMFRHFHRNDRRKRLLDTWVSLADFKLNKSIILAEINNHSIPTFLYFGNKDRIVPPKSGVQFAKNNNNIKLTILKSTHKLINSQLNDCLANDLKVR